MFCPDSADLSDNAEVTIGHVDCTADGNANRELCSTHGVNGFPTLNIYKNGEKVFRKQNLVCPCIWWLDSQAEEYSGKRDLEDLAAFVEKHLAASAPAADEAKEAKDEL